MDYSPFKDYYLIKCFGNEDHRRQFNSGEKIYINSTAYFHDLEDRAQRDFEGGVYQQPQNGRGALVFSKRGKTLADICSAYQCEKPDKDILLMPTENFRFFFWGYICCFSFFSKNTIRFEKDRIAFNQNSNSQKELYAYLNDYAKDKYTFVSVYDAEAFMEVFCPAIEDRGYLVDYGAVQYKSRIDDERIKLAQSGNVRGIFFLKDKDRFSQQKEFRIILRQKDGARPHHLEETGINICTSVVNEMVYLSPAYTKQIGYKL